MPALIGRALEAGIKIPELYSSVSRTHARIYVLAGRYYLEDLGSANGTKVDGVRVTGATSLASSCRLDLGRPGSIPNTNARIASRKCGYGGRACSSAIVRSCSRPAGRTRK